MIPWVLEPDRWINIRDFCRLFNYSYRGKSVSRRLIKTGALAEFGMQTCLVIIPGKSNCANQAHWYIRLND